MGSVWMVLTRGFEMENKPFTKTKSLIKVDDIMKNVHLVLRNVRPLHFKEV